MKIRTPSEDLEFHVFFFSKIWKSITPLYKRLSLLRVIPRPPHLDITRPVPRRSQDDVLNGINVANLERFSLSLAWKSPAHVVDLSQFHAPTPPPTIGRNVFPATILLCKLSLFPFTQLSSPRGALKRNS